MRARNSGNFLAWHTRKDIYTRDPQDTDFCRIFGKIPIAPYALGVYTRARRSATRDAGHGYTRATHGRGKNRAGGYAYHTRDTQKKCGGR